MSHHVLLFFFFFFNDTATTEIYTLSLHDALPIFKEVVVTNCPDYFFPSFFSAARSEEHTSELQSRLHLVCRLLLEKKKKELTNDSIMLKLNPERDRHHTQYRV